MGKPNSNLFKTLISTATSFHKERRDRSDGARKPRKVPKDRCMWSLGKSSWRSREAVDTVEEEGEKKDEIVINGSKPAMEAVHVEEGKGSQEKLEQIQEAGSEQARETVEQDPEPAGYIVRKVEGALDEEGAGRGVREEEAGEEDYGNECEVIDAVENAVERGEADGKDVVIVVSGRESAVEDDEQESVEQNEAGNGGVGGDEAVLDEEETDEHEGLVEEEETEEHEGLVEEAETEEHEGLEDEEGNEEHEGLDEEELGRDRDGFKELQGLDHEELGAEELEQDVKESDTHEGLVTEEAAVPSLRMIQASLKIQAAFHGYLARRTYLRTVKGLVTLQALVRGRNARRAMARLRYVRALVKVQSLVRGHLVRKSDLGLLIQTHLNNRSNHLSIEPQLGLARNSTITINEVDVQQCDVVGYTVGKGRKTSHVFNQDEKLSGSEKKGSGMACHRLCETSLQDMSFPMKDEDQCSKHFSPMKELEECSQLTLLVKEEDEVGITSAFSSSLSSIVMPSPPPSSTSTSTASSSSSSSSSPSPNTTLEDISTGRTSLTTALIGDNNQSINEDSIGVSDPEAAMCERPRSFVFHNDEHIEEKSLCASDSNGSYPDAMESGIIEQISSLVMVPKTDERDSRSTSLKLIGDATNEQLGNAIISQQEQRSPPLSLIIPNYMSMTKSSNAKKVIGSPKLKKSEAVRSRANSPNPKQDSPKLRRDHPQSRLDSLNLKIDSSKSGLDTCKPRLDSPKTKTDSLNLRLDSPKPWLDSPKVSLESPKHKRADLPSRERDPLRMTHDSPNLVKLNPYTVKRRHSLSGLEAKSGLALVVAREVL